MSDESELPDRGRSGSTSTLEHVSLRLDEEQLEDIDELVEADEYENRSDAIRTLLDDVL